MIPTDPGALRRLRTAWEDPEITGASIRERFGLNTEQMQEPQHRASCPRVKPSPMPEWGGVRRRTGKIAGTWRRTDDERNARRRDPRKGAHR